MRSFSTQPAARTRPSVIARSRTTMVATILQLAITPALILPPAITISISGTAGVAAEFKTIRIGTAGFQRQTFCAGISGTTVPDGVRNRRFQRSARDCSSLCAFQGHHPADGQSEPSNPRPATGDLPLQARPVRYGTVRIGHSLGLHSI